MGLSRDASPDDIKRAYRKLARKYHPDVSKETDAEQRFKELGEAYEVLKDPEKRAAYDQLGANWKNGQDFRPPPDWNQGFEFHEGGPHHFNEAEFSDFFESLFGQRGRHDQHRGEANFNLRGQDTFARVQIDIEDSYHGATRSISLRHVEPGPDGRGVVKERTLNVSIPKGVQQGQHIRLAGQGSPGIGKGGAGDLYLEVEFKSHRYYRAEGRDVYLDLPLAPWEAALGATVKTPTPSGFVDLKIPANSSAGSNLRLKGRGIPGNPPGDMYVVLKIVLPKAETDSAKELYREMEQKLKFNPRSNLGV